MKRTYFIHEVKVLVYGWVWICSDGAWIGFMDGLDYHSPRRDKSWLGYSFLPVYEGTTY